MRNPNPLKRENRGSETKMGLIRFPQFKNGRNGLQVHPGLTILEFARMTGVKINAECGGTGTCGKCIVRIEQGEENLNEPTQIEKSFELREKERLACQARIVRDQSDMTIFIKNFGEYDILKCGMGRNVPICLLYHNKEGKVFKDGVPIDSYKGKIYGLAIDIGTTTVVLDLLNAENGDILKTVASTNPQISYGNDVISRIEYTLVDKENKKHFLPPERERRASRLREIIVGQVNDAIEQLSAQMGENISQFIYETVVVGNPTMRNLFFGLDVSSLGIIPYEPKHTGAIIRTPREAGININSAGIVYGSALIGGHVGGDILADIIASGMYKDDGISLLIDIGTNGEVVLGNKDRLIAASCAAGGAFEGASVSCGVGGIAGAIKKVELTDEKIVFSTIDNSPPIGVCGSGLIDLLAGMLQKGIMSEKARIQQDFYITGDLKLTQNDIFQLITSKAALKTGWQILLKHYPVDIAVVKKIYLSGGFGNFIDVKNAMKIGLIPQVDENKIIKIGNGSLEGAREMLLCKDTMLESEKIASRVQHVRTNEIEKDFEYIMAENMYF